MLIFYNKITGNIIGTIEGRVNSEDQLKMWIGNKNKTERIIVNWKAVKWFDKDGNEVLEEASDENGKSLVYTADFEPDTDQKEIFIQLDKNPSDIFKYKIDIKTEQLISK